MTKPSVYESEALATIRHEAHHSLKIEDRHTLKRDVYSKWIHHPITNIWVSTRDSKISNQCCSIKFDFNHIQNKLPTYSKVLSPVLKKIANP